MNSTQAKRILETALICAQQPMTVRELRVLFADEIGADTLKTLLADLQDEWAQRGVELVQVASGWRFQSRPEMREYLDRLHPEKPPKYTRATLETLAIIAYRQPVTRGDIEDIRGVTVNSQLLKQLEDRGWIEVIGHRETVGRPGLYATTRQFLDDLGLQSLDQLPMLESPSEQAATMFDTLAQPEDAPATDAAADAANAAVADAADTASADTAGATAPDAAQAAASDAAASDAAGAAPHAPASAAPPGQAADIAPAADAVPASAAPASGGPATLAGPDAHGPAEAGGAGQGGSAPAAPAPDGAAAAPGPQAAEPEPEAEAAPPGHAPGAPTASASAAPALAAPTAPSALAAPAPDMPPDTPPPAALPAPDLPLPLSGPADAYLQADLLAMIRGGHLGRDAILRIMLTEMLPPGSDEDAAAAWVDAQLAALRQEQQAWPATTDCDRLDAAFAALRPQGILCLPHAGYTQSDGQQAFRQAHAQAPDRDRITGYCFFHEQDLARALSDHLLWLAFGPANAAQDAAASVQAGRLIAAALQQQGLRVEWDGTAHERICLRPFAWQRRI